MFRHILLAIFIVISHNAIIQPPDQPKEPFDSFSITYSPIYRLSQNFLYSLTFPNSINPNNTDSVFFTLVSNNQTCEALFCYYGWVNNFTLNGKTFEGYDMESTDNPMVFLMKGFINKTYSITMDRNQSLQKISTLDLCSKVSNPLASQISSLNPFNKLPKNQQLAVYDFVPLFEALKIQELKNSINLQELRAGTFANTTVIGINKTKSEKYESFTEILAVDSSNNIILRRKIVAVSKIAGSQSAVIQLKIKSSTKFSNIQGVKKLVLYLSSQPKNTINLPILPQNLQLSQIKMNFP